MTSYAPITILAALCAWLALSLQLAGARAKPLLPLPSEFSYLAHLDGSPADGQPVFPDQPPSCPICEKDYGSIDSCAQAAPVLANFSMVIFNPGAFIDVIKCACADTFQSAYPQCVDCFIQTNQTQFLNSSNLPGVVDGIRKICALESSLLGGVATADGEVTPTTSLVVPIATGTTSGAALLSYWPSCSTPAPSRKRAWVPGSVTNMYSAAKRRRMSFSAADEPDRNFEAGETAELEASGKVNVADRFISAPKDHALPLQTTPRTQRIAKIFGLADDRILKYTDTNVEPSTNTFLGRHRFNYYQLLKKPHQVPPTSAEAHLGARKQFVLALDGPGIPSDLFAYPISWSARNAIAVACGRDVYYQNLDTRAISHLFKLPHSRGKLVTIEWARKDPGFLAAGTTNGDIQLWDTDTTTQVRRWQEEAFVDVGGMSWHDKILAVGLGDGVITLYDARSPELIGRIESHRDKVHGLQWRHDGNFLASSDQQGVVQIWDARASKSLSSEDRWRSKMKHGAPVKALAWCPWKPELLATGAMYPDGRIRVWNINNTPAAAPAPHIISLHTSVTSLLWSPHCKELLSTHGMSWQPRAGASESCPSLPADVGPNSRARRLRERERPVSVKTGLTNSLTVHAFPSLRRVVSVPAHTGAVGHSCLSPDGTKVFTICPAEEAMKMWQVWGVAETGERRESVFDKCRIR
ncbi:WD40 repeat-like protein [Trametes coccinea BRFM310]|uniref:WD40 repeat-like protein n=1 Tax=Trametes coccinea (strain BRFM310) TaxID=1353009 RepID=A0A1Y2IFW6_TRAC3|nr:WD40 repeat-like protein [Trametes coccinea BRFM310]